MVQPRNIEDPLASGYINRRIEKLHVRPIVGCFDERHLKRIHATIFRGFTESYGGVPFHPGKFRQALTSPKGDWSKYRSFETQKVGLVVVYSRMDADAMRMLRDTLRSADPCVLRKLDTESFAREIGRIYSNLDYIHPFEEGNSRTLREFTRQLALESGYDLDWSIYNASPIGRDLLYVARDLSVDRIAQSKGIRLPRNRQDVNTSLLMFGQNRDLPDLLRDAISPLGAHSLDKSDVWKDSPFMDALRHVTQRICQFFEPGIASKKTVFSILENKAPHLLESARQMAAIRQAEVAASQSIVGLDQAIPAMTVSSNTPSQTM